MTQMQLLNTTESFLLLKNLNINKSKIKYKHLTFILIKNQPPYCIYEDGTTKKIIIE